MLNKLTLIYFCKTFCKFVNCQMRYYQIKVHMIVQK